jgi:predicted helicase
VLNDDRRHKWSSTLKLKLAAGEYATFDPSRVRVALYRAFSKRLLYYDSVLVHRPGKWKQIFQDERTEAENRVIAATGIGSEKPFMAMAADRICDLHLVGAGCGSQCFPFYTYDPDGANRRENITDAALETFRTHYHSRKITKWDIFHYIYAVLHHPGYREKFAENLKRELPRIPFAPDFAAFARAGGQLARLHVEYESVEPWPLRFVEAPGRPLSYRVEDKMRLSKDKASLVVNPSLTLDGIPQEAYDYRLGNRSALEWVVDQYRVTEDARSGIRSDPNREDDPEYIVNLVRRVVRVSVETVEIVKALPEAFA